MKAAGLMVAALVIAAVGFMGGWIARGGLKPTVTVEFGPQLRHDVGMDRPDPATASIKRDPAQDLADATCLLTGAIPATDGKCYMKTERMPRGVRPSAPAK